MTVSFSFNLHPCKPQCSPSVLSHFGPMQSGITLCYFLIIEAQKQSHGICFFVPVNTFTQSTQSRKQGPLQLSPEGATPSLASGMGYRCTLYLTILSGSRRLFPWLFTTIPIAAVGWAMSSLARSCTHVSFLHISYQLQDQAVTA